MKRKSIICYLMLIIMVIFAYQGFGQEKESVGKILSVENTVTVINDEEKEVIGKAEQALFAGDQIITGEKSSVRFSLNQGSNFFIGESSEVEIDELSEVAQETEEQPVIRLVVGFLRSTIEGLTGDSAQPVIHTPTAVAGVRGTVFDTVVSLDGATVVAVDEGRVEVDCETAKTVLEKGKMAELDADTKTLTPIAAMPVSKRDWKVWLGKRESAMMTKLPQMFTGYQKRFDKYSEHYTAYIADVKVLETQVAEATEQVRKAKASGDPVVIQSSMKQLEDRSSALKIAIKKSRHQLNRFKAIGKQLSKLGKYAKKHKAHFSKKEMLMIQSNIESIKQKDKHLKKSSRTFFSELKKTVKNAKKFKVKKHKEKVKEKKKKLKEKIKEKKNKSVKKGSVHKKEGSDKKLKKDKK